jgi:hypothetical protein
MSISIETKPSTQIPFGIFANSEPGFVVSVICYLFISRQQKTRHRRVKHAPAATRLCSLTQQESSAHDGRVSGDSIPI